MFYISGISGLIILATLTLSGCAKDRTVDDYNREKLYTELAELKAVEGSYTGLLTSQQTQKTIGALQITLRAETRVPNNSQGNTQPKPTLLAEIEFFGEHRMITTAQNSFYQSDSGQFEAELLIFRTGSVEAETIKLSGVLRGKAFSGELSARGFENYGGSFQLEKQGRSLAELISANKPTPDSYVDHNVFIGQTTLPGNNKKNLQFLVYRPEVTAEDEFHTLLVPLKPVTVTLNYGTDAEIIINNAIWDTRTGKLRGLMSFGTGNQAPQLNTDCTYRKESQEFTCLHTVSSSTREATTRVKAYTESEPPPPINDPKRRTPVIKTFNGKGVFRVGNQVDTIRMALTGIMPALSALQEFFEYFIIPTERVMQISFTQTENQTTTTFSAARWFLRTGEIVGIERVNYAGRVVTHNITCEKFNFTDQRGPFSCDYTNDANNAIAKLTFQP